MKTLVWCGPLVLALTCLAGSLLVADAFATAKPAGNGRADAGQCRWLAEALKDIRTVKPGMTRRDLLERFEQAGGLHSRTLRSYSYKRCPYIKVSVTFAVVAEEKAGGNEAGGAEAGPAKGDDVEGSLDEIVKVSPPYLEAPNAE